MIISPGRRYIFVHIPKTGGTSLAMALEERAMKDDLLIGDTPKARRRRRRLIGVQSRGRLWKHSTLADIEGVVSSDALSGMLVFTLVRNPWDRMVSYYHWLKDQAFHHPSVVTAKAVCFKDFLRDRDVQMSLRRSPASSYLRDATGVARCTCFIRLEAFRQDIAPVEDHLGFSLSMPHLNRSDRNTDYKRYYDGPTRDLVADVCAEDIARFGYRYDPKG
ncbi:sulfotransferase family protein [Roseobacter sp. YSTF-M11]|uniref:Sulfotransferase family protein n=1 Tax=Roseobacter insulae TaxID=2859783 RepID=A0A9X1G0G3_9RHOB|nr:sulfotransferase family 2 domain-containing protein [Roseobacter insulae]MBW4710395.1 sulfotransferase family protein [Roseobacter insulae]